MHIWGERPIGGGGRLSGREWGEKKEGAKKKRERPGGGGGRLSGRESRRPAPLATEHADSRPRPPPHLRSACVSKETHSGRRDLLCGPRWSPQEAAEDL